MTASLETELKLALDRPLGDAIRTLVRTQPSRRLPARRLRSVYHDTPDSQLEGQRIALRVRTIDARRHVQTVKAAGRGPFSRFERECDIGSEQPACGALPDDRPDLREALLAAWDRLVPVFATDIRRSAWIVTPQPGLDIEVAIDKGHVIAGDGRRTAIAEAEFELVGGTVAQFWRWARQWCGQHEARLIVASKNDRGRRLSGLSPAVPHVVKAADVPLADAGASVAGAVHAAVLTQTAQVLANVDAIVLGTDPRGPHQFRVALRRLRGLLRFFTPALNADDGPWADLVRDTRALAAAAGAVRDLDVLETGLLARLSGAPASGAAAPREPLDEAEGFAATRRALHARRERAREALRAELLGPGFTRWVCTAMLAAEDAAVVDAGRAAAGETAAAASEAAGSAAAGSAATDSVPPASVPPASGATGSATRTPPAGDPDAAAALTALAGEPMRTFAPARALELVRRSRRRAARARRHGTPEARHELRLSLKDLRYALRFCAPACPDPARLDKAAAPVPDWQDALGLEQDLAASCLVWIATLDDSAEPLHLRRRAVALLDAYRAGLADGGGARRVELDTIDDGLRRIARALRATPPRSGDAAGGGGSDDNEDDDDRDRTPAGASGTPGDGGTHGLLS